MVIMTMKTRELSDNIIDLLSAGECVNNTILRFQPRKDPIGCFLLNSSATVDNLNGLEKLNSIFDLKFSDPYRDRDRELMDPGLCVTHCSDYLFKYAALGNGTDCRCGQDDVFSTYIRSKNESADCNIECVGNVSNVYNNTRDFKCGGKEAYTIYSTADELPPDKVPKIKIEEKISVMKNLTDDQNYKGCFKDSIYCDQRALNGSSTEYVGMTVNKCIEFCHKFKFAALESSSQCFCADDYNSLSRLNLEDCSSSCSGDDGICGGPLTISVYNVPHNDNTPLIIGLCVGISLGIIFLAIICYFCFKRRIWGRIEDYFRQMLP